MNQVLPADLRAEARVEPLLGIPSSDDCERTFEERQQPSIEPETRLSPLRTRMCQQHTNQIQAVLAELSTRSRTADIPAHTQAESATSLLHRS